MAEGSINNHYDILLIGGSAGSLDVILKLLPAIDSSLEIAVVIIIHRNYSESFLSDVLREKISWDVRDAEEKEPIRAGVVYIAPADYHLLIEKDHSFSLDYSEKIHFSRPAIDATFETGAEAYGPAVVAILLSGANADGAEGLKRIKASGGLTIVQDPAEAIVPFMPEQAIASFNVDYIADTTQMIEIINRLNVV